MQGFTMREQIFPHQYILQCLYTKGLQAEHVVVIGDSRYDLDLVRRVPSERQEVLA